MGGVARMGAVGLLAVTWVVACEIKIKPEKKPEPLPADVVAFVAWRDAAIPAILSGPSVTPSEEPHATLGSIKCYGDDDAHDRGRCKGLFVSDEAMRSSTWVRSDPKAWNLFTTLGKHHAIDCSSFGAETLRRYHSGSAVRLRCHAGNYQVLIEHYSRHTNIVWFTVDYTMRDYSFAKVLDEGRDLRPEESIAATLVK